ncbi:hypothetical protein SAMN05216312_110203 [Cohnella sp. OV330]|uniref:hypothetical protein n=1 Tax=Cohnella sp. OV330 TaxID=1855288 RepID=UPI0008DF83A8|nr:hypothetical protein [Cohnella sp. OV330]SFB50233.1 hypothetical protein SAMN05216312_110203 [Cohnella sp. OV330]
MRRTWLAGLTIVLALAFFTQSSATAASPVKKSGQVQPVQVDPMTVTQKLKLKDDRGKNWVLKNAKEYRLKWSLEDSNPYQNYEADLIVGGKRILVTSFDSAMSIDLNGNVLWEMPLQIDFNRTRTVGTDGTVYFLNEGDGHIGLSGERDETLLPLSGIERISVQGAHVSIPSVTVQKVVDKGGFVLGYPNAGDANGNLLLLTTEGLTSYKPDGAVRWNLSQFVSGGHTYHAANLLDLFCDDKGFTYLHFEGALLQIDQQGVVQWSASVQPDVGYFIWGGYLISQKFDFKAQTRTLKAYSFDKNGRLSPLTDKKVLYQYTTGFSLDQSGGIYELDEPTNTLTDKDWATGKIKWRFQLSKTDIARGISLASFTMRSDRSGNVYFSANVGNVYSLDSHGKPRFTITMDNGTIAFPDIIPVSDKLTLIINGNQIACIEKIV